MATPPSDTGSQGIQIPSPTPPLEKETGVGGMGEHTIQQTPSKPPEALTESETEKISHLAQKHVPQEPSSVESGNRERHIEQEKKPTQSTAEVERIRETVIPSNQQPESSSLKPLLPTTEAVATAPGLPSLKGTKSKEQSQVEEGLIPDIVIPGVTQGHTIEQRMKDLGVPGVSITLVDGGDVQWSQGYGTLDEREHTGLLTQAASISKVVTSLTVLSLIDSCRQAKADGKPCPLAGGRMIDLDTDVGELLDKGLWDKINPAHHKVTIQQLLSHTAGIPEGGSEYYSVEQIDRQFVIDVLSLEKEFKLSTHEGYAAVQSAVDRLALLQKRRRETPGEDVNSDISRMQQQILDSLKILSSSLPKSTHSSFNEAIGRLETSLKFREEAATTHIPSVDEILQGEDKNLKVPVRVANMPGTHFEYSNLGFTILQKVVEVVTGTNNFADVVRDKVLNPLGMKESTYSPPIERTVRGNDCDGKPIPESWRVLPHRAAGGLWTTAKELAQVILAIQEALSDIPERRPQTKKPPIISRTLANEMMKSTPESETATKVKGQGYGLGMFIDGKAGYFWHNGIIRGFKTLLIGNQSGKGLIVLTDSQNGDVLYPEIVESVANVYKWPNAKDLEICEPRVKPEELFSPPIDLTNPQVLKAWVDTVGGRYGFWNKKEDEGKEPPDHEVVVCFDEKNGKMLAHCDGGDAKRDKGGFTLEIIPLGNQVAYHPPGAQGPAEVCRFTEESGKKYLSMFNAKHIRIS